MSRTTLLSVLRANVRMLGIASVAFIALLLFGGALYVRSRDVMEQEVKMRLKVVAQVAAMQFDAAEIATIDSMSSPHMEKTVQQLRRLRDETDGLRFAYILRRTRDPMVLEFVADADSLSSDAELDHDLDGVVDANEEASYPGDLYDISDNPALQGPAFEAPTTDEEIIVDQWGELISGYAPIRDPETQATVAVLGVDMQAKQYASQLGSIFSPGSLFTLMLGVITLVTGFILLASRRKLEELERMNDERTRLLQLTFHQLGEPVTIFKWSAEMLREAQDDKERLEAITQHLQYMDEGLNRLGSIVDALAEAERVEKGTLVCDAKDIDARELADNAVKCLLGSKGYAERTVDIEVAKGLRVHADVTMISDVLCKMLRNAADYSKPEQKIVLRAAKRKNMAEFSVEDQGDGIAAKDLAHIAEKYRRGDKAYLRKPDGKGLSLYTARGVIEMSGGKMWIKSTEGEGTSIFFTLPLA